MFQQKEYSPIGQKKEDEIDLDKRFDSKNFDEVYKNIKDLQTLKNVLWTGINKSKFKKKSEEMLGKFYSNIGH